MLTAPYVRWIATGCLALVAGCSGSTTEVQNSITAVQQDLGADPSGFTTVIDFSNSSAVGFLTANNFEASGGQTAQSVSGSGTRRSVLWDAIVSPQHAVRIVGRDEFDGTLVGVTTTDSSVPTFVIQSATQTGGLGGDQVEVQFSGPRVVPAEAVDPANWTLRVSGVALDLTGSSFSLDEDTQLLSITTGAPANLHASFTLAAIDLHSVAAVSLSSVAVVGAATGDSAPPSLVSALQNLSEDEFGRVVDFNFSEAMDPVFSVALGNFAPGLPDFALSVTQPDGDTLRVRFNNPLVPAVNSVQLQNVLDAHGNALPTQTVAVAAGGTVANAFETDPELLTVSNVGGDMLVAEFVQALDIDDAPDFTHWVLESPTGSPVALGAASFDYDLLAKSLTVHLTQDLSTGETFTFGAFVADAPRDVDGEQFLASFAGTVGGDTVPPAISTVVQNRDFDGDGRTLDVSFDEDVDQATAETLGNWSVSGATVQSATLLAGLNTVRVAFDRAILPGSDLLNVAGVEDIGGVAMAPVVGAAVTSSDVDVPVVLAASAAAIEGADNDTLTVQFDDQMVESEVEMPASWSIESPIGNPLAISGATITYDDATQSATLVFDAATGIDLARDDDFLVALANMRDLGGNPILGAPSSGLVVAESTHPVIDSVWVETSFPNRAHVRFSEACAQMDDLAGLTSYEVRTGAGVLKGAPTGATPDPDGLGVELVFGFALIAGSDTIDVKGVTDLAGNALFPVFDQPIEAEDPNPLGFDTGNSLVVILQGEENDLVQVEFDRRPGLWRLTDPTLWGLSGPSGAVDLGAASFEFDGATTLTIRLDSTNAPNLETTASYDLSFDQLITAQGVALPAPAMDTIVAIGDTTAPNFGPGALRLYAQSNTDTVLVEMNEALDPVDAANPALFLLNGVTPASSTQMVGKRTVRALFAGGVTTSDSVDVTLSDLAGFATLQSQAVGTEDVAGPLVTSVSALSVEGPGGDTVSVAFNKPVEPASGFDLANYSVDNGSGALDLTGAGLSYVSATNTVTIELPVGVELDPMGSLTVDVSGVRDHAGLVMNPPASIGGSVTGDLTPPTLSEGFVNWREDPGALVVELRFSEVVEPSSVGVLAWTASGGQTITQVENRGDGVYRLTLSAPLSGGQSVAVSGATDLAGNQAASLVLVPSS